MLLVVTGMLGYLAKNASDQEGITLPLLPGFNLYTIMTLQPFNEEGMPISDPLEAWEPVREHTKEVNKVIGEMNTALRNAASASKWGYIWGAAAAFLSFVFTVGPLRMAISNLRSRVI